jgi:hypothetical protein
MADELQGWVKLWRSIRDNPRRKDPDWLAVWVDFLTGATHKPFEASFDGKIITLTPGQMITGRHAQAKRTGVHESKVRRVWAVMKSDHQIDQLKGVTSSVFTILNWSDYQTDDQPIGQPNGQRTANERPTTDHKQEQKKDIDTYASVEPPPGFPKSEDEAIQHAMHVGAEPEFIRMVWNKAMSRGGNDAKDVPIRKWSNYIATEWKYERARREKERTNANCRPSSQQRPNRNTGTANEGNESKYERLGKVVKG